MKQTKLPQVEQGPYLWMTTLEPLPINDASQNIKVICFHEGKGIAQSKNFTFTLWNECTLFKVFKWLWFRTQVLYWTPSADPAEYQNSLPYYSKQKCSKKNTHLKYIYRWIDLYYPNYALKYRLYAYILLFSFCSFLLALCDPIRTDLWPISWVATWAVENHSFTVCFYVRFE